MFKNFFKSKHMKGSLIAHKVVTYHDDNDDNIESESIKITKDLDARDDLYKFDDFFAADNEEYLEIASNGTDNVFGRVMPKSLKLRKDIGSDGEVLETLEHEEEVSIIKAFNGWYYVQTSRGTYGWCMSCHIDTDINGYDKEEEAKSRNEYIEKTLKDAENSLRDFCDKSKTSL